MSAKSDASMAQSSLQATNRLKMTSQSSKAVGSSVNTRDEYELARTGKKQILKRNFGLVSMLGFGCITVSTWEGVLGLFTVGFTNGGQAGLIYGFIITWIGTLSIFITLSELASMMPSAGGQYHWCAMLAPPRCRNVLSYISGWLTIWNWEAALILGAYVSGSMIQGLLILHDPTYQPKPWQGLLISWACLLISVLINAVTNSLLAKLEGAILIFHVVGFFAILIPLVYLAPSYTPASQVFTHFLNEGGWSSQGLSFWIGLSSTILIFAGADSMIHMIEEVHNATVTVPRAIMGSILINGILGLAMLLAVLFTLPDTELLLENNYNFPYIQLFVSNTSSIPGATAMACIVIILVVFSCISLVATTSRLIWSFARDRGVPGWQYLQKVDSRTSVPFITIITVTITTVLFTLIALGSSSVLNIILSLGVCGGYGSYLVPASLLLWHRCTGKIAAPPAPAHSYYSTTDHHRLDPSPPPPLGYNNNDSNDDILAFRVTTWGPWRVPGILGIINNAYACAWMVIGIFFSIWPSETPVTPTSANYSIVVTAGIALLSGGWYAIWGWKSFNGPKIEVGGEEIGGLSLGTLLQQQQSGGGDSEPTFRSRAGWT